MAAPSSLKPVVLQLKWKHQFQFAGYYAAIAKGYYREAGLHVILKERIPNMKVVREVTSGRADFGISSSELLLEYYNDQPVMALGAIFQHAPDILLSRADSGINTLRDLKGKRVMVKKFQSPAIMAMLASQGINKYDLTLQQNTWSAKELIEGKTDVIPTYLTSLPFVLKKSGIPANIMRPISYGFDFYGDILFTSRKLAESNPKLVEAFFEATKRGWRYAMQNPTEIISLIKTQYQCPLSVERLIFEAETMRELILPNLVELGSMSVSRWNHIAKTLAGLGLVQSPRPLDDFIYVPLHVRRMETLSQLAPYLTAGSCVLLMAAFVLLYFNRGLKRGIEKRTRELNRNRESLRQVIDLVPNMIYAVNQDGTYLLVNRTMADTLGTTVEGLTGTNQADAHPDRDQARRMQEDDAVVFDTGFPKVNMEEPCTFSDGSIHWLQTTRLPFISADTEEPAVLVLSIDITDRRRNNDALKASEERFRAVFNQTYQFSGLLDLDGTLIQINDSALNIFGVTSKDVLNKPFWETLWWTHDLKTQQWLNQAIHTAAQGETLRREVTHHMPSGELMTVDFSIKPARNDEGRIIFLIAEGHDITGLKKTESELKQLNEELEQRVKQRTESLATAKEELLISLDQLQMAQKELVLSEKLAALGGLVAGVAHEINTPLGVGVTASSFLQEKINELSAKFHSGELKRSDLEKFIQTGTESSDNILANLGRAAELIKSFKQVAADQSSEVKRSFNLHAYTNEILLSLRPKLKQTRHHIENDLPDVEITSYPGAFMQIITNLVMNSLLHAYDEGEVGQMRVAGSFNGDQLSLTFRDDGRGMQPETLDKIFEPFYTTQRETGGTGLGLHIVFNIVTQTLGGTIRADSTPGEETIFTITMPLS